MFKKISQYIIKLRKENNFSQEYIAKEINVSRPTYMQIERGARELTVSEAQRLADIFGLSLENFLATDDPKKYKIDILEKALKIKEPGVRISVPAERLDKFKEVLLYILALGVVG